MIQIQNVSTSFAAAGGTFTAVDDVSLHVKRGSIQGIIGFSGAGKSTLLRNINLLERPTSGRVIVDGVDLMSLSDAELRTIPVIVLSASRRPSDIRRSSALRAAAFIAKPRDFDGYADVIDMISAFISQRAATDMR